MARAGGGQAGCAVPEGGREGGRDGGRWARSPHTLGPLFGAPDVRREQPTECPWHSLALCSLLLGDRLW